MMHLLLLEDCCHIMYVILFQTSYESLARCAGMLASQPFYGKLQHIFIIEIVLEF